MVLYTLNRGNMSERDFLIQKMESIGLSLSEQQARLFERFYSDLTEKNQVMNLTTITGWKEVVVKHFVDSLAIVKICGSFQEKARLIDVGTGAGFPGIPLAIMFPELEIVMVDSVGKKISFIQEEIAKLGFMNVTAIHARVEDFARQPEYRDQFDYCVSRAVANLSTLSEYCLPFVKKGGSFIAYKSGNCQDELDLARYAIGQLSGRIKTIERYLISDDASEKEKSVFKTTVSSNNEKDISDKTHVREELLSRILIEIEKTGITPKKYPRKAGTPSKCPLSSKNSIQN